MSDSTVKNNYRGLAPNFERNGQHDYTYLPDPRRIDHKGKPAPISAKQARSDRDRKHIPITLDKPPWMS